MKHVNTKHILAGASALFLSLCSAQAATYTWVPSTGGTWNTTTANWNDGVTNPTAWVNGNTAAFSAFGAIATINLTTNISATGLTTSGGSTITVNGTGTLDLTNVTTAGTAGSAGSIDMFVKLTGSHGLTYHSTGSSGNQGRLNLKTAADYTGDTFLTGTAFLLSDNVSNALPTTTTLNLASGTTFRLSKNNITQQLAGLVGPSGTVTATTTGNTITLNTKSGVTTTYSGSITSTTGLGLVVNGSGTQALNGGTMSFNGSTTVSGGVLSLGNNLSATSSVTVNGGTLQSSIANVNLGVGAVSLSSGSISPRGVGTAGKFTLAANQNFTSTGGTMNFDLGTSFDQIAGSGTGTFSLTGTTLALNLGAGFDYGLTYNLFSGFSGGSISSLAITGYDTVNWTAGLASSGVLSFTAAAIPEPSTYAALAGLGTLAMVVLRRHRAARS